MKHSDSVLQHHVPDGPSEAAEKDVWQDSSAGHHHHDCEWSMLIILFYKSHKMIWHVMDLTKPLFVCSARRVSFWPCAPPSGWVNQERKKRYCSNYKMPSGADKFLFYSYSGRISAWLCCFASCKSCLLPGKLPVSSLIITLIEKKIWISTLFCRYSLSYIPFVRFVFSYSKFSLNCVKK